MKFEYDHVQDKRECVAYVDGMGDFIYRTQENGWVMMQTGMQNMAPPESDRHGTIRKFYKGDKITITF